MIALPITCPVFIGRRDELEVLHEARRGLARSRGGTVLVGGEAGVGKSRLIAHFIARTGDRRARNLVTAECREDIVEPLRPILAILEALLGSYVPDGLSASAQRALGRIAPQFAPASGREAAAGPVDRADFHTGLAALLVAFAAKRATIVILEDIHWADPSTLDFLTFLVPRLANTRLLVVATHRTEGLDDHRALLHALSHIEREPTVRRVVLDPFGGRELRDFVAAALGDRATIDDASFEDIVASSDGNAFYAEELLKHALTRGRRVDSRLPMSIRGTIVLRLQSFDAAERRVLAYAAVLGLRFDPTLLAAILERDIDDVLLALQHARDAALLVEDHEEPTWLRFRHALTRQVIYDDILAFDRRRLHTRILETLESSDAEATGSRLFVLAEHAAAARDASRTLLYGERAGNAAWSIGAFSEAIVFFERALEAARGDVDRARLLEVLAFPVSYGGDAHRAVRLWEEAVAIHVAHKRHADVANLHQLLLCERFNIGDIPDEGAFAVTHVEEHRDDIRSRTRDSVFVLVANLRSELCHVDEIDALFDEVDDVEALHAAAKQNFFRARLNRAAYFGRAGEWYADRDRLVELTPLHANPSVDALNAVDQLGTVATSGLQLGALEDVESALARGRGLLDDWGFERYTRYYDALDMARSFSCGSLATARARFDSAAGDRSYLTSAVVKRTAPYLALALDDDSFVERAITTDLIERERAAIRANASSHYSRLTLGGYALWLDRRGSVAEAAAYLGEALESVPYPSPLFVHLITFALRHLGADRVPGLSRFAGTERLAPDDRIGRTTALVANAALARRSGDERSAVDGFRRAAAAYAAFGFRLDAAHASHLAGDVEEARTLYLGCGAVVYARAYSNRDAPVSSARASLSERERTVADFVALGLTNVEIAERMSVSTKTVEKYLASIFRKLDLRSRWQIAGRLGELEMPASEGVRTPSSRRGAGSSSRSVR